MMVFKVETKTVYSCSLDRAFKTPMLCDLSKIHTGYGFMPQVTHSTDDKDWGKPGSSKKIFVTRSLTQKGGFASMDRIIERSENNYWKIQVDDFQSWMIGFYKFVAEWRVFELEENRILIKYTYWLHSNKPIFYFFNLLFVKLFWKSYMKQVLENVRVMAINNEPYLYE